MAAGLGSFWRQTTDLPDIIYYKMPSVLVRRDCGGSRLGSCGADADTAD